MTEDFLHYLWKHKLFYTNDLSTTTGFPLKIISQGVLNFDSGPDFSNSRIEIDELSWAGNVEIHLKSSDWFKHKHDTDRSYNNVILHVVYEDDTNVNRRSGEAIPVLELKGRFEDSMFDRYQEMMDSNRWIPCEKLIETVPRITFELWLERLLIERIEQKTDMIQTRLTQNHFDWEQSFYESLASSFGLKVNAVAFELLAKSLPLTILQKHANNLFQIEALLFGQAGMLQKTFIDDYPNGLKKEYKFLSEKYSLSHIDDSLWNYLRLRPSSFATHRIAQFAMLIYKNSSLFSTTVLSNSIQDLFSIFQVDTSDYWHSHYLFDKEAKVKSHKLGATMVNLIVINTVIPYMFLYGKYYSKDSLVKKALDVNDLIPAEDNVVIRNFKALNINTSTAFRSQALLQLKKKYCDQKKCLHCAIGNYLVKPKS
ncbi:MAG: DUF2851 family protein [Bacteroidota bacterium]